MWLSRQAVVAIKLNAEPAYRIAQKAGFEPSALSHFMRRVRRVRRDDPRLLKLAGLLGLTLEQCVEGAEHDQVTA